MTMTMLFLSVPAALLNAGATNDTTAGKVRQPDVPEVLLPDTGRKVPTLFSTNVGGDYTSFTAGKGSRRIVTAGVTRDFGSTTLVLGAAQGERDFGPGKGSRFGVQASALLSHDWNSRITSVTSLSAASNSPVFGRFQVQQDVDLKVAAGTIFRVGGRYTNYYQGQEVRAGHVGVTQYFAGGLVSYRLSAFDSENKGRTTAHLVSLQLKDPRGSGRTQIWAGTGSSLHDLEWMPDVADGRAHSLSLKRSQPLGGGIGLSLSVGRTWYDRPLGEYQGTKFGIGLSYKR